MFFIDKSKKEDNLNLVTGSSNGYKKIVAVTLFLIFAGRALADVNLADSFPADGAVLSESVTDIRLWFDQTPDPERSELMLIPNDDKKRRIAVFAVHSMGENDLMGFVQTQMPPGRYQLRWHTAAVGSEAVSRGQIEFEIVQLAPSP